MYLLVNFLGELVEFLCRVTIDYFDGSELTHITLAHMLSFVLKDVVMTILKQRDKMFDQQHISSQSDGD